jgi:hypothetical protein
MSQLIIRIKKKPDGATALSCQRPDGSIAWQRQQGGNARFFPYHDLTHYAVETVLQYRDAFYGLIAQGWDFTDFASPSPRGPIPTEAQSAEQLVGLLSADRISGDESSADDFNAMSRQFSESRGLRAHLNLTNEQLAQIRQSTRELFARWKATPPGETLELIFDITPAQ